MNVTMSTYVHAKILYMYFLYLFTKTAMKIIIELSTNNMAENNDEYVFMKYISQSLQYSFN